MVGGDVLDAPRRRRRRKRWEGTEALPYGVAPRRDGAWRNDTQVVPYGMDLRDEQTRL